MSRRPSPLRTLRRLADEGATGELVCALSDAEVHVHLQSGRVAWATTSEARFAFTKYLIEQCQLDRVALRELVDECRRDRRPLGEKLVEWGLATQEQIRDALHHQILDALGSLKSNGGRSEAVFLQRGAGYAGYDSALTFPLDELDVDLGRRTSRPPRPRSFTDLPAWSELGDRLVELVNQEPDVRWAEHLQGGRVTQRAPLGTAERGVASLAAPIFADLSFVAVRADLESVVGIALQESTSVWCGLRPDAVLGVVLLLVRERLGERVAERRTTPAGAMGDVEVREDRGVEPDVLSKIMELTPQLWSVALVDADASVHPLAHRRSFSNEPALSRITRLSGFLRSLREITPPMATDTATSIVACSHDAWFFGGELFDGSARDLWLVVDPTATQGMGWALLTALLRRTSLTTRELRR